MSVEVKGATLMKRSRNRSVLSIGVNWQLRRISLSETKITYGTPDGPPKDFIIVNSSTTCHEWSGEDKEFAFRTQTGPDELILCATSEEDRKEWIEAVRKVANPPLPTTGDPVKDAAARAEHEAALAKQRAADEAERALKDGMMSGLGSMSIGSSVSHSVTSGIGGGLMGAALNAAEGAAGAALAAGAAALEQAAREKAAAEAEAARQTQFAKIARPVQCQKKLSNESSYHTRYIWVNQNTSEFHWAKTDDVAKSKCVSIKSMCKAINSVGEVGAPNFTMELQNHESVFSGMFSSVPTGLDVKLEDNELNQAFIDSIRYLMTK